MTSRTERAQSRETAGPPGLLLTKLHPPPQRDQTLVRERLLERLRPQAGLKLTVVAAPPGFGKTTLLGEWHDDEATRRPVAWVSIDDGDNDPVVLWSHVVEALRRVCPDIGALPSPESLGARRIDDVVLPRLVNALIEEGDVALILDDFHRLSSGAARDSVGWLVDHAPASFQLVLSTRSEPALPLGALRAHGELLEVRSQELGFTFDEADSLLNTRLELGLAAEDVDDLVRRTEGWPAGLYLAALSLTGIEDRHGFVTKFGGNSRYVVDFLIDEVLEAHDRETQALMLRSSILERLSGPLCDAVLEREGSAEVLGRLARTNLFLLPLDDEGEWYRFHHLFAQLLRVELEHREPGLAPALHRRAFVWHREHGSFDGAIEHALEACAFDEAGALIASAWIRYALARRNATVLAWLDRFPRELLRHDSQLLLVDAWVRSLSGQREAALAAIAEVERLGQLDRGPLPDGFGSLEGSLGTLRATVTWGDVGAGLAGGYRAAELEGPDAPWRAVVCFALGCCLYFAGELGEADRFLAEAEERAPQRGLWLVTALSKAFRSLVAGDQGRIDDQIGLADEAVTLAREQGHDDVDGEILLALGASLEAQGRLEEALTVVERGVALIGTAHPRNLGDALIRRAALLEALNRSEVSAAARAEARTVVDSCVDPRDLERRLAALERRARPRNGDAALSERELVILRMLTGDLSERDIGRELYLSHNTVHSHTRSIYRKLGASSRSEALERARELGLIR